MPYNKLHQTPLLIKMFEEASLGSLEPESNMEDDEVNFA
jgi:hypothetical protein